MAHMFESGYFTRQAAWHGLGEVVQENLGPLEAFQRSGLNWRVSKAPLRAFTPDERLVDVKGWFSVLREKDDTTLGVVKGGYELYQNEQAFRWAVPFVESGLWTFETAGALWKGARCWLLLKQGESEIVPGDRLRNYLLAFWSHDGQSSNFVTLTSVRVVCWNTLQMALQGAVEKQTARHTGMVELKMDQIRELYLETAEKFKAQEELFKKLAAKKLDRGLAGRLVAELFPVEPTPSRAHTTAMKNRAAVMQAVEQGSGQQELGVADTAYGWLMGVSEAAEHFLGGERVKDRGFNILWGTGANLVNKAQKMVMEAVGVNG